MHKSVLLKESIDLLKIKKGDVVVDATLGGGGHAIKLAEKVGKKGRVIAIDLDKEAIEKFENKLKKKDDLRSRILLKQGNFRDIGEILIGFKIKKVDAILADLGWRIEQVENDEYGMSFRKKAKLDMRLGGSIKNTITAEEIINQWSKEKLVSIFKEYGEEREAKKIANAIEKERREKRIIFTDTLAKIVSRAKRNKGRRKCHPATKVFQALRIVVNDELNNLEIFLQEAVNVLGKRGRLVVISFHSLEDRMIKKFFRENARGCVCPKNFPICICDHRAVLKNITRGKAITASEKEIKKNYRSRSARLRGAEKI